MRKTGMAALALLAGCVGNSGIRPLRPLEIPTAPYQEIVTSSLLGSLSYEGGCLLFHDEKAHDWLLPVWPIGTTFNGSALIFHLPGKPEQRLRLQALPELPWLSQYSRHNLDTFHTPQVEADGPD